MVWIHGGSWLTGSGGPVVNNPDFFMDKGVVHVGVNYRLGALGFLALQGEVGGNQGLRDQNMALSWVQENIRFFGGDPGQVTIFGESSGSSSVFLHSVSPLSAGLVHRAIAQSGGNLGPGMANNPRSEERAWEVGRRLAEAVGCTGEPGTLLPCLQGIEDGFALLEAFDYGPYPVVDKSLGEDAFLPLPPREILKNGQMLPLDLILGFNHDEGLEAIVDLLMDPTNDTNFAQVRDNWDKVGPFKLFDQHEDEITEEVVNLSNEVANFYLGEGGIVNYDGDHIQEIVDMYSDAWYWATMDEWTKLAMVNNLTTYRYLFNHNSALGLLVHEGVPHPEQYGVCHGDELPLLFIPAVLTNSGDRQVSRLLIDWWTNFAKHGNPSPDTGLWQPWNEGGHYLEIDSSPSMALSSNMVDRMEFWRSICGNDGCPSGGGLQ